MPACLPCYYPPDGGTRAAQTLRTAANSQKGVHLNLSYTLLELFDGNANKTKTFSEKFEIGARERMNYSVYLPKHYNPKIDLLVYSSPAVPRPKYHVPANTGAIFQHLENVMDDFNMGWIGADNCGNLKSFARRIGCVMLATRVAARYGHRPEKTYAAGYSGGGLVASYVNTAYPMIFSGGIYIAGALKWANNKCGIAWDPAFGSGLRTHRFVFLSGERDANLAEWKSVHTGYVQTGIREARMLLIRNITHHIQFDKNNERRWNPIGTPITQSTFRQAMRMLLQGYAGCDNAQYVCT